MATGTLTLTFDTPEITLTGNGEFNISEAFQSMIATNPQIKEEISLKIAEIFGRIKSEDVAKEWVTKIKKAFNLEPLSFDLQSEVKEKMQNLVQTMSFGQINVKTPKTETNPAGLPTNKLFTNLLKEMNSLSTSLKSLDKFLPAFSTKLNNKDTVFDETNEVVVSDFTEKALEKLATIFGDFTDLQKRKTPTDESTPTPKNWLDSMLEKVLPGLTLASLPSFLKGLVGPALLAGGLLWLAWDGLKGWLNADKWKVAPLSAAIGGVLGGTDEGVKNGFYKALQGGLIGGTIGSMVGGPVGLVAGALLGAALGGVLGYIGGENLAKSFDNLNKDISNIFNENIEKSTLRKLGELSGILSYGEEDKSRALRSTLFDTLIRNPFIYMTHKLGNYFEKSASEAVLKDVAEKGFKEVTTKEGTKLVTKKSLGTAFKIGLARILKFAPGIGAIFGLIEALDYWKDGYMLEGINSLAGGILASMFPVIGSGAAILLDVANIGLQSTDKGKATSKNASEMLENFREFLKRIPLIGSLVFLSEALGYFSEGQWLEGIKKLGFVGLNVTGLTMFFNEKEITNFVEHIGTGSFMIWEKIKNTTWNDVIDSVFNFFTNLGKNVKEWFQEKFSIFSQKKVLSSNEELARDATYYRMKREALESETQQRAEAKAAGEKKWEEYKKTHPLPTETQFMAVDKNQKPISFQPAKEDKVYQLQDQTVFAKPDDILGKTFDNINKQLIALNKLTQQNGEMLKIHTEIFREWFKTDQKQLEILPSLIPAPVANEQTYAPMSDSDDRIFAYRQKLRNSILDRG